VEHVRGQHPTKTAAVSFSRYVDWLNRSTPDILRGS